MTDPAERPDDVVRRDAGYWDEVARAVGTGTPSILLGTSTRSLRKNLDRLRKAAGERVAAMDAEESITTQRWDPVPHLAALIDGLHRTALQGNRDGALAVVADLLAGPYAALRGGLLLDEPGREHLSTEDALREVAGPLAPDPAALDDDQLDAYFSQLDDLREQAVRENNRRATGKLLEGGDPR